jgi:hypothetical protein
VPVTGIVSTAPVIEPEPPAVAPIEIAAMEQHDSEPPPAAAARTGLSLPADAPTQPKAAPVIPLVHAPDDPGPEVVEESAAPAEPQSSGGWRKLFE